MPRPVRARCPCVPVPMSEPRSEDTRRLAIDLKAKPVPVGGTSARVTIRASVSCPTEILTKVKVRKFEIIDEPPRNHRRDFGPQPLKYLISSFADCTNVILRKVCRDRGIAVSDLMIDMAGVLHPKGISGHEK